jgi:hypothetical protein
VDNHVAGYTPQYIVEYMQPEHINSLVVELETGERELPDEEPEYDDYSFAIME